MLGPPKACKENRWGYLKQGLVEAECPSCQGTGGVTGQHRNITFSNCLWWVWLNKSPLPASFARALTSCIGKQQVRQAAGGKSCAAQRDRRSSRGATAIWQHLQETGEREAGSAAGDRWDHRTIDPRSRSKVILCFAYLYQQCTQTPLWGAWPVGCGQIKDQIWCQTYRQHNGLAESKSCDCP